ncbi:MAG: amidohydrolase family protein, partial [Chitinophaga rupis]
SPNIYYSALMAGPSFFDDPRTIATAKGGTAGQMPYMRAVTDTTNLVLAVAEAKGTGATGIKLYAQLSGPLVARIVAEARKQGLLVWGHAWLSPAKPSDLIKAGVGSISHAPLLLREMKDSIPAAWKKPGHPDKFWEDSIPAATSLFQSMKENNTILDATLTTYEKWGREDPAFQYNYDIAKRMTARAYKAGVRICTGTDDDQDSLVQREMHLLVKDAGFSPLDALIAATQIGAEALGIAGKCGTIEVGKEADLVILNSNPLDNIDNVKTVSFVIKGGRVFKK